MDQDAWPFLPRGRLVRLATGLLVALSAPLGQGSQECGYNQRQVARDARHRGEE